MQINVRKIMTSILSIVLVTGLTVVAAPAQAAKTTITYFSFSASPDHIKTLNKIVGAFERKNPTIQVKIQSAAYADYFTKLKTRIAANQSPDTFELDYQDFVTYADAGALLNLKQVSMKDKAFNKNSYYGKAYDVFAQNGKQYGLPSSYSTVVLFYNKDLFKAAGVDTPNSSWDWSDEAAADKALAAKLPAGTYADFQPVQFWEFYKVLAQAGGQFLSANHKTAQFNKQPGINALNWLVSKQNNGWKPTPAQMGTMDDGAMFAAGKLAMWHSGIWEFDAMKNASFKWDVAVEPGGVTPGNHFFANDVSISSKTKNADAAWKWAKFLTSDASSVKSMIDSSWEIPATSAKAPLAAYLNSPLPPANRQAVFDALKNPVVPPVIRQQGQLQDAVNAWLSKALDGSVSVVDALNGAATDVNAILAKE